MDFIIRELKQSELPLLEHFLYGAIFQPDETKLAPRSILEEPALRLYVDGFGTQKGDLCLCAEARGRVTGAVWVRIIPGYGSVDAHTPEFAISVDRDCRGMGVGTALLRRMLERLKAEGYEKASLAVQKENRACRLYRALGFRVIGEQEQEYLMAYDLKNSQIPDCCAVVVAAGTSARMGFCKQKAPLCGVPALERSLGAFMEAPSVGAVVVVCPPGEREEYLAWLSGKCGKPLTVAEGCGTRQASAAAGVRAALPMEWVAVHDGARALITPEEIEAVLADARRHGASTLAVPVKDTIKSAGPDGFVKETPPRESLWAVQTPQVFRREAYLSALTNAVGDESDDCRLFERLGLPVHLCRGHYTNLKLTTPEDFPAAEAILKEREEGR